MPKKLLLLLLVFSALQAYSQDKRKNIFGIITTDSTIVKDVHIFNISSRKGTITNLHGEFQIPVKENDTLLISDIQYESQEIIIGINQLNNLQLNINLIPKVNELNEVEVKEHELTGNLNNDARNTNIEKKISKDLQGLDAYEADSRIVDDYDINRDPDARELTDPTMQATQGNIGGLLVGLGLNTLINEVSKIGRKKRIEKRERRVYEQNSLTAPNDLRKELGDSFFTNTLKVPPQNIDDFINYCKPKGIVDKYVNGNKIEMIDILINQSRLYLAELNNDKE